MPASLNHRQQGFALLDSLLALVLVSVGMLALAWLQVESLRSVRAAGWQSMAVLLAADLSERIRAAGPALESLAASELQDWQAELQRRLPPGSAGHIEEGDSNAGSVVSLRWPGPGGEPYRLELPLP